MPWRLTDDPDVFEARVGALLREDPARHTVLLTLVARLRAGGPPDRARAPELCSWHDAAGAPATGAAVAMPPTPLVLGAMPTAAAAALADALTPPQVEVAGPSPLVEAFLERWVVRTGQRAIPDRLDVLMRLSELEEPIPPAGRAVVAGPTDRRVAIELVHGFFLAVHDPGGARDVARQVDDRLSYGGLSLWYDEDGRACAVAGLSRVVAGMARIGPVFTAPEARGRGCGGALTAAVARQARAAGAEEVLLFADTANPTSTGLYERLGFERVFEQPVVHLEGGGG